MGKKPRSQRRKKGSALGEQDDVDIGDVDLPEDHTVADSFSTYGEDFELEAGSVEDILESGGNSSSAATAALAAAASRQARLMDAILGVAELASEKRTVKRECLLKKLFRALTQFATGPVGLETVELHLDSIVAAACAVGLRATGGASSAEQYAACRVLEATSVVLGENHEDYCDAIDRPLRKTILLTGRATAVRGAALRALSMSNVMCCCGADDAVLTESILDLCEAVAATEYRGEVVPPSLRATALDCWALLSTTIPDVHIADDRSDQYVGRGLNMLPLLKDCLETTNVELRSAAGECVALIHEARLNLGIQDDQGENITERRFRRGSWDGSEWEVLMDEVKQLISQLSVESGHHMSKRAKKAQRATFREFMATIVDDEAPCEVVSFRGGTTTLTLQTWKKVVQLNFVRHCLQGGFQIQLATNSSLHAMFGVNPGTANGTTSRATSSGSGSLSQVEKRLFLSKTSEASKTADRTLTQKRRVRTNVKNDFLNADEESIWN